MNTNYIDSLWADGYTVDEVIKTVQDSYASWQEKQKDKKIEEARAALVAAAANFAESLGFEISQEAIDKTIEMVKNVESGKIKVMVGADTSEADKRIKKFLRGIL